MALESPYNLSGFAPSGIQDLNAPLVAPFFIERVQLQFEVSKFAAVQVANNVIILALETGKLLRIDLASPQDVEDFDLPKKTGEVGTIRKIFLDPTASHLLITTTSGENFYLHSRAQRPRHLSRLKGLHIECVAWSPALPSTSTREILLGTRDGLVFEVFIEASDEFLKKDEKYVKQMYRVPEGQAVTGLHVDLLPGKGELRRVVLTTTSRIMHFVGKVARHGHSDSTPIFTKLFDGEAPESQSFNSSSPFSSLVISPEATDEYDSEKTYAWLSGLGVYHGKLQVTAPGANLAHQFFAESKMFPSTSLPNRSGELRSVLLTHFHFMVLSGNTVYVINRYDDSIVFQEEIPETEENILGLCADLKKSTYWIFTTEHIFEIVATEEDRDIWKIMLNDKHFDNAMRFAKTPLQKDAVSIAFGDYLVAKGQNVEAASVWGRSSKSFEEVALTFLDMSDQDALRRYLLTKLATIKKISVMQRMIAATWLVEIYMAKLNALDDTISAKSLLNNSIETHLDSQLSTIREEYQDFVSKYKGDLDRKTTYEIISSHGREEELLYFASAIDDHNYVLSYWIQRKNWAEALNVLKKQRDPEIFYKNSSVLLSNAPMETVNILMRQSNLNPRHLVPALLAYNKDATVPLSQNQAVRYLLYVINQLGNADAAVHNTLLSIYASHPSGDETALLQYLESHSSLPRYDADFALRLCIQHNHVQSCVHIFSSMGQYLQAVEMALQHGNVELASIVANRPEDDALRKKLWLAVAKKVIQQSPADGIKNAIDFLKRCELLKIEDLIPFFPDFVVIDDFKDEICTALEDYSSHIDSLKREMDESTRTAENIRQEIASLDTRFSIIEPGSHCHVCAYPLLSRQFFVFPCQHAFHSDCLSSRVIAQSGVGKSRRIRELQTEIAQGLVQGKQREKVIEELDGLIASACILCSEFAVRLIDEPFIGPEDDRDEWAL